MVNATKAAVRISGGVVLADTSLSTPTLNHTGISINAPPIAKVAPTTPATNPPTIYFQTFS
jgi:hypothetical protein